MTLWTPSDISSVALEGWYRLRDARGVVADGADLTIVSGFVTAWADRSGNGRSLAATNTGAITYSANGLSTGDPGTADPFCGFRTAGGMAYPVGAVIGSIFVGEIAAVGRVVSLYDGSGNDYDTHGVIPIGLTSSGSNYTAQYWQNFNQISGPVFASTVNVILEGVPLSTTTADIGLNGVFTGTPTTIGMSGVGLQQLGVFADPMTGSTNPYGVVSEVIVWSGVISTADLQRLEGYVAWNNGQQALLPTGHPYYSAAPTVSTTAWTPDNVHNLIGWYDPADNAQVTQTSGYVTAVTSKPSLGPSATIGGDAGSNGPNLRTSGAMNSLQDLYYEDDNRYAKLGVTLGTAFASGDARSAVVVMRASDPNNFGTFGGGLVGWENGSSYTSGADFSVHNGYLVYEQTGQTPMIQGTIGVTDGNPHIGVCVVKGQYSGGVDAGGSNPSSVFVDGTLDATGLSYNTNNNGNILIGASNDATGRSFLGEVGDVILVQGALSATDRQKCEGYLAWKWGIQSSLPTGHPYHGAAPLLSSSGSGGASFVPYNPWPQAAPVLSQ